MHIHRLDRARDPNFWSVRVNADIRIIVHKTATSLLLCYVGHHDAAYGWAERRKIERHPVTGAAQLIELRERLDYLSETATRHPSTPIAPKPLFADVAGGTLLACGVPFEWLDAVRQVTTEDRLLNLFDHLPQEAAEALLSLATGETPEIGKPARLAGGVPRMERADIDRARFVPGGFSGAADGRWSDVVGRIEPTSFLAGSFHHPDAQRRFRALTNAEELERALDFPWEKWAVFLHPAQRRLIERDYTGPARVSGSAGTSEFLIDLA